MNKQSISRGNTTLHYHSFAVWVDKCVGFSFRVDVNGSPVALACVIPSASNAINELNTMLVSSCISEKANAFQNVTNYNMATIVYNLAGKVFTFEEVLEVVNSAEETVLSEMASNEVTDIYKTF